MDMKVRELLNRVKEGALTYGKAAGRFATDTAEKARINLQIFDLNTEVDIACKEIGKLVYAMHAGDEVCNEAVQAQIEAIDTKKAQIAELRARLEGFRAAAPECACTEEPAAEEPACCCTEDAPAAEEPAAEEPACCCCAAPVEEAPAEEPACCCEKPEEEKQD